VEFATKPALATQMITTALDPAGLVPTATQPPGPGPRLPLAARSAARFAGGELFE
jgi:hypothetical protein